MSWPAMVWIGGALGAGKSTIARELARQCDLPLHPIDLWTYAHLDRLPPLRPLADELAQGPEYAADAFVQTARLRLELVVADVRGRALGDVPALVEGPQLFPSMADGVSAAVWLVPDAAQTRRAREERLARVDNPAGRTRLEALLARDAVLADRVRRETAERGRVLIEVPAEPDWAAVGGAVREAIGTVPALAGGSELRRQRQYENLAACTQGRLWQADLGLAELPPYPFACECGTPGCTATWAGTPEEYDARGTEQWLSGH
ncbi:hypothetical protein [Kribbella solani]|uniref:hypothetical protein n=1 Tax=Kribbella solani TaxID=236067 RepID=UPI0029BF73BE|nr:hypothetical protein [Kribbella solani]MDX2968980.1 hypothetical protein [Kribbella solani]